MKGGRMAPSYLYFDIETHGIDRRWDMMPQDFFRLGQYAWGNGEVVLTDNYHVMVSVIRVADYVVGHNIHSFDLSVLLGPSSIAPLTKTQSQNCIAPRVSTRLLTPSRYDLTMSNRRMYN